MTDHELIDAKASCRMYDIAREALEKFKNRISHGDLVVVKGVEYPAWVFSELWGDPPHNYIQVYCEKQKKEFGGNGARYFTVSEIDRIIPKESK